MILATGLILAALAAGLHVFIFWLESVIWTSKRARAVFGTSESEAAATKELAFNQGFYNLFLAILVIVGIVLFAAGMPEAGVTLVFAGVGSMFAAALVLFLSSPDKRGAALKQGTVPIVAIIALAIGLATGS